MTDPITPRERERVQKLDFAERNAALRTARRYIKAYRAAKRRLTAHEAEIARLTGELAKAEQQVRGHKHISGEAIELVATLRARVAALEGEFASFE